MSALQILHALTSGALVILCWWLAHEEARRKPPGRLAALGYSLVGIAVLVTGLARSVELGGATFSIMQIAVKAGLVMTFTAVALRLYRRRQIMRRRRKLRQRDFEVVRRL